MASVAKLKDKARDFERKEDWNKAVEAYLQVIQATEKGDGEVELALYNRVGDLYLRLGRPSDAVDYYAKAADHYGEAGLYNNAIALCNKALRYQPDRLDLYRKLGKLSAEQGFITDARRWYLEYAEKLAKQGRKDEAFEALKEFAALSEDPEIREMLAAQLEQRGEHAEAVNQLRMAWTQYSTTGAGAKAEEVRQRIVAIDPSLEGTDLTLTVDGAGAARTTDLPGIDMATPPATATSTAPGETIGVDEGYGFGEPAVTDAEEAEAAPLPGLDEPPSAEDVETSALPGLESTDMGADAHEVLAADLPTLDVDQGASLVDEDEAEESGSFELPTLDDETAVDDAMEAAPLPGLEGFEDTAPETDDAAAELPMLSDDVDTGEETGEWDGTGTLEDIGLESAEFDASEAESLPTLDVELEPEDTLETQPAPDVGLPSIDLGGMDAEEEEPVEEQEPVEEEAEVETLQSLEGAAADEEAGPDTDEWGDFPGDEEVEAPAVTLDEARIEQDIGAAIAGLEQPIAPTEPEPVDAEPEPTYEAPEPEYVTPEPTYEAPEPEYEEPEYEEPEPEEPAAAPISAHEAVPPTTAASTEMDVDSLIASARARFAAGERREALASLEAQHANLADANRVADAYQVAEALVSMDPDTISSHQARVEYAFRLDDRSRLVSAYLDFAACLERTGASAKAESVYGRVLEIDPQNPIARAAVAKTDAEAAAAAPAAGDDFIDLGGLLLGEEEEETTRFVVAETVESGDEERDFADMLSQFRAKIAQHVPQEDTESHYDLGIAFKEMGLIDEAISEFQTALRGGNERLKIYEELGQCFMMKEQYNIAAKLLARGAQLPAKDDAELLGVYYQLGRCYEELGQKADAKEAYERVLGLDINFRDVNERLARL